MTSMTPVTDTEICDACEEVFGSDVNYLMVDPDVNGLTTVVRSTERVIQSVEIWSDADVRAMYRSLCDSLQIDGWPETTPISRRELGIVLGAKLVGAIKRVEVS